MSTRMQFVVVSWRFVAWPVLTSASRFASLSFIMINSNYYPPRIDTLYITTSQCHLANSRITCYFSLNTSTNQRCLSSESRDSLSLHIRTHE